MSGYDLLKQELLSKGYTKQQVDASIVKGVLEVLAGESGSVIMDIKKLTKEREELLQQNSVIQNTIEDYSQRIKDYSLRISELKNDMNEIKSEVEQLAQKLYMDQKQYVDRFFEAIEKCETPEQRDRLKTAQMYVNSVNVDTKYDNTAFIIGLASILSPGGMGAITTLRKLNKEIPEIDFKSDVNTIYTLDGKGWNVTTKEQPNIVQRFYKKGKVLCR